MVLPDRIVLASGNAGKVREINEMLAGHEVRIVSQSEFNVAAIEETGLTFVENALLKARHAARHTGLPAIADDSGIELDALDGRPGIYSARYAGTGAGDADNLQKLMDEVAQLPEDKRGCRFVCLMVYLRHAEDPIPLIAEGLWEGIAVTTPAGTNGFGYDPMFYVPTHHRTSAELPPKTKNRISHRGQALRRLVTRLQVLYPAHAG